MKKVLLIMMVLFMGITAMAGAGEVKEPAEEMTVSEVMPGNAYLPRGTMIPAELLTAVSSGDNKAGDKISFKVCEDVAVGNIVVIPKGTVGEGYVKAAKKAGLFGKSGSIQLDASNIETPGGLDVPLTMDFAKIGKNQRVELNYNNSIAGAALSALIPGSNQKINEGAPIMIFVPVNVDLQVKSDEVSPPADDPAGKNIFVQPAPMAANPYVTGNEWTYTGSKGTIAFSIVEVGKKKFKGQLISTGDELLVFDQSFEAEKTNQFTSIKAKSKTDGKKYTIQLFFRDDGTWQYVVDHSPKADQESIILIKQDSGNSL
ncbi:hypothetical protein HSX37_15030|uniref:Conjugation TrbI-like protein n=1 Tax=Dendrosporobacter quercicolus TaxID=146817 RepID=A0A1G9RVX4_9FIRM|nr:hypothetical protein [Dendrosporobacter quercicolus]NSL49348.1 hypothetical protein [Dendrosporobacter quercicolus DSM 1736]SDM26645.1 conjugation TrbI-like protein [Dendrosporobacter quercicolus]